MDKYTKGMQGQHVAEKYIQGKGYCILARNYRVRTGEIDIIARSGEFVVFIEVKYRSGLAYGYPRESVDSGKQQRIIRTAMHYISTHGLDEHFRFDVIEILEQDGKVYANHIENAFEA